ncbi:hypothetical protein PCAR4_350191 [Paraburkholderia caribensis]|nr:hypothetical protein PCAR4_350191 [Paraburkholderia caribensis]
MPNYEGTAFGDANDVMFFLAPHPEFSLPCESQVAAN